MRLSIVRALAAPVMAGLAAVSHAHEGHGLVGPHWHATDVFGFLALAAAVGVAIWYWRK